MKMMSEKEVEKLRETYPVGTKLELDYMNENDMESGLQGSVKMIDDAGQIHMSWSNGRGLALVPGEDLFHIVREKEEQIKVLVVEPMKAPYEKLIDNDYRAMQEIVGGCIEFVALPDGECHLYCNEEGRLDGLTGNRKMDNDNIICGTFFICADNGEGDDKSLTDSQIEYYSERFKEPESFQSNETSFDGYKIKSFRTVDEFLKSLGTETHNDGIER